MIAAGLRGEAMGSSFFVFYSHTITKHALKRQSKSFEHRPTPEFSRTRSQNTHHSKLIDVPLGISACRLRRRRTRAKDLTPGIHSIRPVPGPDRGSPVPSGANNGSPVPAEPRTPRVITH
jgi:hypothetical protein